MQNFSPLALKLREGRTDKQTPAEFEYELFTHALGGNAFFNVQKMHIYLTFEDQLTP